MNPVYIYITSYKLLFCLLPAVRRNIKSKFRIEMSIFNDNEWFKILLQTNKQITITWNSNIKICIREKYSFFSIKFEWW